MLGHDTLPEIATLNGHRIIPPRTSVSYSRHSCEGGLAQTYETSHGHQTWYWTVEGREFAAVPIVEIVNGNFNDFDGSYVQMVTLCNTLTIQETRSVLPISFESNSPFKRHNPRDQMPPCGEPPMYYLY